MAKTSDITVEILKQIRDEVRQTNGRLDQTNASLDHLRTEMGERFERAEKRQTDTEVRLATEIVAVVGAVNLAREAIIEDRQLRRQVADHEARLDSLERSAG